MENEKKLLPLGTRVLHFKGGEGTHGEGTIVAYNTAQGSEYMKEKGLELIAETPIEVLDLIAGGIVNQHYSAERCPYVVQWDESEQYLEGYRDVYEESSLTVCK